MSRQTEADESTHMQIGGWAVFVQSVSACFVLAGVGLAYLAFRHLLHAQLVLLLVGIYAAIGIFFLVCAAFGLCRFISSDPIGMPAVSMLDQLPEAVVLTSEGGRVLYANRSYCSLSGLQVLPPEILLGRDEKAAANIYHLGLAARERRIASREIRQTKSLFAQNAHQPGREFVYSVRVRPFELDGYRVVMWTIADLTEQHARQENFISELQDAVNHLDRAPAGFLCWDREERIVYLNAPLASWFGIDLSVFTPGQLSLTDLAGARNADKIRTYMKNADEIHGHRNNGHRKNDGFVKGNVGACRAAIRLDSTGCENQRGQLVFYPGDPISGKAGESLFRAVVLCDAAAESHSILDEILPARQGGTHFDDYFDVSPIALAVINRDRQIERANSRFLTLFRLDAGSVCQSAFVSCLEPQDRRRVEEAVQQIFAGAHVPLSPIDAVLGGEEKRYIRLYISSVGRRERGEEAVVISVVETTEQRALEQQMEQSQKMQAVGQLAGGIAHDFNNVLTAIIMSCDLLLSNHRSSDPSHPDIMNIKNNANRAASIVRQLLAFSRRQTLRPEILDMTDVLADLRMLLVRLAGNTIHLHVEHGRFLWPVKADQAELERVVMNLVANARDAMPRGGRITILTANVSEQESRKLDYRGFQAGDYVLIEVRDTGTGIEPDILEKIFDPFFTTKEVGKGTGLGLSMVYGIVTQTGGYIHCDSRPGEGTCFSIYLPRYSGVEADRATEPEKHGRPDRKPANSRPLDLSGSANVLLVEDEDAVRMGGVKALQSRGYTVFEATSGIEALKIVEERKGKIDIVVSDVVMPEMDGPTLLKELRRLFPEIKFIFVSGYAQDAFAKNLPEDASFAFLAKPFSLKQLAAAVKEMLNATPV